MIDELNYDYTPIGMPNVLVQEKKTAEKVATVVHPFMAPLIMRLAKVRPKWKIVAVTRNVRSIGGGEAWYAHRFYVYEGKEELGLIQMEAKGDGYGYAFDCPRLAASRQRGHITITSNANKAFKLIIKNFGGKTPTEILAEGEKAARDAVHMVAGQKRSRFQYTANAINPQLLGFVRVNYDAFREFAKANNVSLSAMDQFLEHYQDYEDTLKIAEKCDDGYIVVLHGSDYLVKDKDGAVSLWTSDALSPHLKRCVGMLKLADVGQHIPGMGVRGSETALYVVPEPKEAK